MKSLIIAIDGYAACGKSTLARQLAEKLHYRFIDTGAMYRAVTLYLLDNNIDWNNAEMLDHALHHIHLTFLPAQNGISRIMLNNTDVEDEIRSMRIAGVVSEVAAISAVRSFLVEQQRAMGVDGGIVMDGRDIGTVVFPHAQLKIFVTARMEVRVQRRMDELHAMGLEVAAKEVQQNLVKRDREETTRLDSPLRKANDALELDTSDLSREAQLAWALEKVQDRMQEY